MKAYHATGAAVIDAAARTVYEILADYRNGHAHILPKPYFVSLEVEQGGFGAGTIVNFEMRIAGQSQNFRAAITEPQPGRVLVESNLEAGGAVTKFEVVPLDNNRAHVTITTDGRTTRAGVLGSLERLMTEVYLRRVYGQELKLLAALAAERSKGLSEQ